MITNKPLRRLAAAIFSLFAFSLLPMPSWADEHDGGSGKPFSVRDLRGPYGFSFDGTLVVDPGLPPVTVAAVGQLVADGNGGVPRLVRTLNLGGIVILEQVASGNYEVNANGTGVATFRVETIASDGEPPFTLPSVTIETFSFVINRPQREIQFIGRRINDETGMPVGLSTIRGVARRQ